MASSARLALKALVVCSLAYAAQAQVTAHDVAEAANVGISVMLLGNVAFMMGLFYLVNHKDQDMRMYSWRVISATISIFSAVLMFQGVNGIIEETLLEDASEEFELFVSMVHMLAWVCILQLALAYICGAIGTPPKGADALYQMELQGKCWGILLGHITGFAAINAFGVLQHQVPRRVGPLFAVAPAAWIAIRLLGAYTGRFREEVALGDDDKVDEAEKHWIEETEETEDDVVGLAVSFTISQAMRFAISGVLPNPEGEEKHTTESSHGDLQVAALLGCGLFIALLEVLRNVGIKSHKGRITKQMRNIVAMSSAWFFYYSTDWWLSYHFFQTEHGMMKQVVQALFVTSMSLAAIFGLIKLAESDATEEAIDHAIKKTVQALGILIGFSWEKAFDVAVVSITSEVTLLPGSMTKLLLAAFLAVLVIPAWRKYILPTILEYDELDEEEEERAERGEGKGEAKAEAKAAPLAEPLLAAEKAPPASTSPGKGSPPKRQSLGGMDSATLKQKLKEYKGRVATLEARNSTLEASLGDILQELWELRRISGALR